MVTAVSGFTLQSLTEKPETVYALVGRLFPSLSPEKLTHAWTKIEMQEALTKIRRMVAEDPDVAFSVVAVDETSLHELVLKQYRDAVRRTPEDHLEAIAVEVAMFVAANTLIELMHQAQAKLEQDFLEEQLRPVREAYQEWLKQHPSYNQERHVHVRCGDPPDEDMHHGHSVAILDMRGLRR